MPQVHVISKADIAEHLVVTVDGASLPPLPDGYIRASPAMISLTSNNLSYAQLGTVRSWWDTYPVPHELPAPYNDPKQYGICPAWGWARVSESNVPGVSNGTVLWGFWPSSDLTVDLRLVPGDASGHWVGKSEHRKRLMNLYQRYIEVEDFDQQESSKLALEAACRPVWEAGYLLNLAVFGNRPTHPLGVDGDKWDHSDSDLSAALVVSLSASGKTARAFTDSLIANRVPSQGPLALLAVTSHYSIPEARFSTKSVSYKDAVNNSTLEWVTSHKPRKIVVVDFGGRGDSLQSILVALEARFGQNVEVVTIGVGGSPKLRTAAELGAWAQRNAGVASRIQMNASGLRDAMIQQQGAEAYFRGSQEAWHAFANSESAKDLRAEIGSGVECDNGFEGGWTKMCNGEVPGEVALAYTM